MGTRIKRLVGFMLLVTVILGVLPCVAVAMARPYPTKIVFGASSPEGFLRHWSLDATSVAPVCARARLMYRQPVTGRWVGYPGRKVTISREATSLRRAYKLTQTTDRWGYVTVRMVAPAKCTVAYLGSYDSLPSVASQNRVDDVAMTQSTSATKVLVDESTTRLTFITDYRYNPTVAQTCGGVALTTSLGVRNAVGQVTDWIQPGKSDVFEWHYAGYGRSEVSFLVPSVVATDTNQLEFRSTVTYAGLHAPVSSGPLGAPIWQPTPDTTGLWLPPTGSTPTHGSYVYLQSDPGDYVGQGKRYLYSSANAEIAVSAWSNGFRVKVAGSEWWDGMFTLPNDGKGLRPGYFPDMRRFAYYDPSKGALDWTGCGRGNNALTGWLIVDSVTYTRGVLTGIDLRFEQHGQGGAAALRGAIHWVSPNPPLPAGPLNPIPAQLWRPSAGSVPATGTVVYLESDPGDYIGMGGKYTYTPSNCAITLTPESGNLFVRLEDGVSFWTGRFRLPATVGQFTRGYYPYLSRAPFCDPAQGGLDWGGNGNGSNTLTGWFVVDDATYVDGVLTGIELRFEQHTDGETPALHGLIRWSADN